MKVGAIGKSKAKGITAVIGAAIVAVLCEKFVNHSLNTIGNFSLNAYCPSWDRVIYIACLIASGAFLLANFHPRIESLLGKRGRWMMVAGNLIIPLTAVFFYVWIATSKVRGDNTTVLIAPFASPANPDAYNVNTIIYRAVIAATETDPKVSVRSLEKPINEATSKIEVPRCLKDCGGNALIWGSYSTNPSAGTLILHLDFSDESKCLGLWAGSGFSPTEISTSNHLFQTELKGQVNDITRYLLLFSTIITDTSGCKFRSIPSSRIAEIQIFLEQASKRAEMKTLAANGFLFISNHFYNLKNYSAALTWMTKAVVLQPDNADNLNLRALIYRVLGKPYSALDDLKAAAELKPKDPHVLNNMGIVFRELGALNSAAEAYDQAISNISKDVAKVSAASFYSNRGSLREFMGYPDQAFQDFESALKIAPELPAARRLKAQIKFYRGDLGGAETDLQGYIIDNPSDVDGLALLCALEVQSGKTRSALATCERAYETEMQPTLRKVVELLSRGILPTVVYHPGGFDFYH